MENNNYRGRVPVGNFPASSKPRFAPSAMGASDET